MDEAAERRVTIYYLTRKYRSLAWAMAGWIVAAVYMAGVAVYAAVNSFVISHLILSRLGHGVMMLVAAGAVVAAQRFFRESWRERVDVGAKLAELDAPPPGRPWLPTVATAALTAGGGIAAAIVTAMLRD